MGANKKDVVVFSVIEHKIMGGLDRETSVYRKEFEFFESKEHARVFIQQRRSQLLQESSVTQSDEFTLEGFSELPFDHSYRVIHGVKKHTIPLDELPANLCLQLENPNLVDFDQYRFIPISNRLPPTVKPMPLST